METIKEKKSEKEEVEEPKAIGLIDKANEATRRAEKAKEELKEQLDRQEEIAAKVQLAGRAEAGAERPKKQEETPQEYAQRIMRGEVKAEELLPKPINAKQE